MPALDDQPTESLLDGRYRLGPCVGRGATSTVYCAEDLRLGRTVAIKLLKRPEEMPMSLERVRIESALLAMLDHPSLVTLYDARLDPGHPQYLAMEYVDGPTLASRLVAGPLPPVEAALLARDIAQALQVVHDAGVIHRDVKPSNVLVASPDRPGARGVAKLTDFGVALGLDDARLTSPGVAIGTAAYMAPEQVRATELTTAVDVYSLGLVLIEALTGEPAYPVTGGVQTALRRLTEPPAIPSSVGEGWRVLLTRMTRTEPGQRPSAGDVALAAAVLADHGPDAAGETVRALPLATAAGTAAGIAPGSEEATKEYPAAAPARSRSRRLRFAAVGVVGAAALAAGTVVGTWSAADPVKAPEHVAGTPAVSTPPTAPADADIGEVAQTEAVTSSTGSGTGAGGTAPAPEKAGSKAANPNSGPGNNSGKSGKPPGKNR